VYFCDPTNPEWVTGDRTGVCWAKTPGNLREILRASAGGYALWVTGDRTGVCWAKTPGNLREILRASAGGYALARVPGLEWQDDVADELADLIVESGDVPGSIKKISVEHPRFSDGTQQIHLRWACQDGIARATFRKRKARNLFDLTPKEEPKKGNGVPVPPPTNSSVSAPLN